MLKKAQEWPLPIRIVLSLLLPALWIYIASGFDMDIQANWLISTFVIVGVVSIFFPLGKKKKEK